MLSSYSYMGLVSSTSPTTVPYHIYPQNTYKCITNNVTQISKYTNPKHSNKVTPHPFRITQRKKKGQNNHLLLKLKREKKTKVLIESKNHPNKTQVQC